MSDGSGCNNITCRVPVKGNAYIINENIPNEALVVANKTTKSRTKLRIFWLPKTTGSFQAYLKLKPTIDFHLLLGLGPKLTDFREFKCHRSSKSSILLSIGQLHVQEGFYHFLDITSKELDGKRLFQTIEELLFAGALNLVCNVGHGTHCIRTVPSVHLTFEQPPGQNVICFYNELLIPVGHDHIGSYYMACGASGLYCGLQVISATERRILFSVWSNYQTDNPSDIPPDYKVVLVGKGQGVITGEFGNEGSGGQSYSVYNWEPGKVYKFMVCAKPEGDCTVYTLYFGCPEMRKLGLFASWRKPKTNGAFLTQLHSFVEHFYNDACGHLKFKAFFMNQWIQTDKFVWLELTRAKMTTTACPTVHQRYDIDGGSDGSAFFLSTGGFEKEIHPQSLETIFQREGSHVPPLIEFG